MPRVASTLCHTPVHNCALRPARNILRALGSTAALTPSFRLKCANAAVSPRYTTAAGSAYATIPGGDHVDYLEVEDQRRAPTPPAGVPDHLEPAALPACDVLEDPAAHSYETMAMRAPGDRHPDAGETAPVIYAVPLEAGGASVYAPVSDTAAGDATDAAAADSAYIVLRDGNKMYGGVGDDTAA